MEPSQNHRHKEFKTLYPLLGTFSSSSTLSRHDLSKSLSSLPHLKKTLDEKLSAMMNHKIKYDVRGNNKCKKVRQLGEPLGLNEMKKAKSVNLWSKGLCETTQLQRTQRRPKELGFRKADGKQSSINRSLQKKNLCTPPPTPEENFLGDIVGQVQSQTRKFEGLTSIKFKDFLKSSPQTSSEMQDLLNELEIVQSNYRRQQVLDTCSVTHQQLDCFPGLGTKTATRIPRSKSAYGRLRCSGIRKVEIDVPSVSLPGQKQCALSHYLVYHKHNHK